MELPIIFGHRGGAASAPENTLAAFRLAQSRGVDGIELDVRLSRDGELVVIHDADVARTTSGIGAVAELDADILRGLDAGDGEPVPLLHEVFECVTLEIQIEVKDPRATTAVAELLLEHPDWAQRSVLSSFDHRVLREAAQLGPGIARGLIVHGLGEQEIAQAVSLGAQWIYAGWPGTSSESVAAARSAGLIPVVWLVDDEAQWERALEVGVAGVSSDHPERLVEWRARR